MKNCAKVMTIYTTIIFGSPTTLIILGTWVLYYFRHKIPSPLCTPIQVPQRTPALQPRLVLQKKSLLNIRILENRDKALEIKLSLVQLKKFSTELFQPQPKRSRVSRVFLTCRGVQRVHNVQYFQEPLDETTL